MLISKEEIKKALIILLFIVDLPFNESGCEEPK